MWELDYKESWALKNWCFWTVVLQKTLESPLDCKEIQPVHPKGNQSGAFIGRTDAEAKTPILWPPDGKNWLIWKDPDAGKDWRQEEKGMTEDETVGWHHWVEGYASEQASGVSDEQGSLVCCSPWGHKMSDTTERLNWAVWKKKGRRNTFWCSGLWKFHTCDAKDNWSPRHTHKCWIEIYFRKCTVIFLSKEEKRRRRKQKEKLNSTKGIVKGWIKSHLFVLLFFFFGVVLF